MFLAIVVVALATYEKAPGSKVKDANHGKPKKTAPASKLAAHSAKQSPKSAAVGSPKRAEPEIDDRYEHMIDWNMFEENKDKIN